MSARSIVTRREFVQAGAVAGAGLVLGFRLPAGGAGASVVGSPSSFAPNAWLRIDTHGIVTLTIDKSEMGQGSQTGLAVILAEELEAEWSTVRLGPVPENPVAWSRRMRTGGSSAIHSSWESLRRAGAAAREMLISAAAE
ncbi:MAG TPA: molybdopterin cofactor-binding domain-containing protein, partial [Gemmatimonadales bacterium]|nr:molybdopterin cofactor-binding domain-containing protein [Gemmatimonadales bacterium]